MYAIEKPKLQTRTILKHAAAQAPQEEDAKAPLDKPDRQP